MADKNRNSKSNPIKKSSYNGDNNSDFEDYVFVNHEEIDSDEDEVNNDLYDYEDKDEDVLSEDDDDIGGNADGDDGEDDDDSDDEDERHARLLHNITGIPTEAFAGKGRKRKSVVSEACVGTEFNPSHDVISVEDVKERQEKLAKMRRLIFHHELKAQRISKIKSKTYRKINKTDKMKAACSDLQNDPEAERELAEKERKRADQARMTLRHKNQGNWAKLIIERGLDKQDGGTRAAISEQLHQHILLTRKMDSVKDDSSSDDSAYEDDEGLDSSDEECASTLVAKAKKKTLKLFEQEDEISVEDVKERQEKLAKMRRLLFHHDLKAKRISKIKSKTNHKIEKKDKMKAACSYLQNDPEAETELAEKERKRAEMKY